MKIKVCGLTDEQNVNLLVKTKIDFAGFIFYQGSKRCIGENTFRTILKIIPRNVKKVGVFVNEHIDKVLKISEEASLDIIQLHGDEDLDYCRRLKSAGMKVIKAFRIKESDKIDFVNAFSDVCDFFLFDTESGLYGGSGKKFNWDIIESIRPEKPFFISGGIEPQDALTLKEISKKNNMMYAVDINSKFETAPGIKDIDKIRKFIIDIKNERL
ncbi:MAG: phosphoribosylanthranilate isomerase [Bacteroidales bacterium]|nr:phosphoribosylanthranilate isomerase [Bacteroidales bacterium]